LGFYETKLFQKEVNVKKKIFSIWSVLLILLVSIAVLVPGCDGGACIGEIEVKATLCDVSWNGSVQYTLTGPGAEAVPITGTNVTTLFDEVECGNWTCEYVSGGPPGAYLESITLSPTQEVTNGAVITFTLNFELDQDAWIDFLYWTVDGVPEQAPVLEVEPWQIVDVHFQQGVAGCEGRIVAVNETSRLWIHYMGWTDMPFPIGEPECGIAPVPVLFVVNDLCAVSKTTEPPANPAEKVSQNTTYWGEYVEPDEELPLFCCENTELDVETIWMLEKEIDYTKSINWFGVTLDPGMHECVLFDLLVQPGPPGYYVFSLSAEAEVVLMDDVDVDIGNNKAVSPPLSIWVWSGPPL